MVLKSRHTVRDSGLPFAYSFIFNLDLKTMDWCLPLVRLACLPQLYSSPEGDTQSFFFLGNSRSGKMDSIKQYSELPQQFSENDILNNVICQIKRDSNLLIFCPCDF